MADVHTPAIRSFNMSRIRSKNTKPEILVRKFLFARGFRYRLHDRKLPGKPDLVLPKYKAVIFIDGCFWHGHANCRYFAIPKTRTEWWTEKINRNIENDKRSAELLQQSGWRIFNVWECDLKRDKIKDTLERLAVDLSQP